MTVRVANNVPGKENCLLVHLKIEFKKMFLPPSLSLSIYSALRDSAVKTPEEGKKLFTVAPME